MRDVATPLTAALENHDLEVLCAFESPMLHIAAVRGNEETLDAATTACESSGHSPQTGPQPWGFAGTLEGGEPYAVLLLRPRN